MWRLSGYSLIFKRSMEWIIFTSARLVFRTVQRFWWKVNGTNQELTQSGLPQNYDRCVQVLRIIWWNKFDLLLPTSLLDFIFVHDRFESPKYIFDNDQVSLFMIDKKIAVFSEPEKKDAYLWKIEFNAFMRESQVVHSKYLLVVPMEHFRRMAEELGDPRGRIILNFNTGRCGSTLLGQMAEETGSMVHISEANQITQLAEFHKKEGASDEMRDLARGVVRWTCRPYHRMKVEGYLVKLISMSYGCTEFLKEIFPDSVLLFMYRDVVEISKSIYRAAQEYPTFRLTFTVGKISPMFARLCAKAMGFVLPDYVSLITDDLFVGICVYITTASYYLNLRGRGVEVAAIRYEDLVSDPVFASGQFLKYCGLPGSMLGSFVSVIDAGDSQRNSVISRNIIGKHKEPVLTPEARGFYNLMLKKNGLPLIGEDGYLEGTISKTGCA